jgi:eukaryotic-like serine/threonine-protein kinase
MIGKTLGHYEISNQLGKGGMGEVYRAHDTKLNRDIALKVLPAAFANDADRMARFKREAQLLASLNHPNIAAIYGLEESGGVRALVMELAEGQTLAERILKGPIPLDEALGIARQIAEALEGAHEKGIIHRDLKPANIKIAPEGAVKVLDFGLAKALEGEVASADASESPTLSLAATQAGVILGTAAYMAPEQARGSAADKRCDIWSFGVVLFEMLTGKQLFAGETVSDTLAAVLRADIDWNLLPANTPPSIRTLLRRCLTKDRKQRLRDIGDAVLEPESETTELPARQSALRQPLVWVLGLIAAAALLYALWNQPSTVSRPVVRFSIPIPPDQELMDYPAISADGQTIACITQKAGEEPQLYLHNLNSLESRLVKGSAGAQQPFFQPDGKWIAFFAHGKLQKSEVEVAGGYPIPIAAVRNPFGGTWNPDDTIIFTTSFNSGLFRISANAIGSPPERLSEPNGADQGYAHVWPQSLPDGDHVLFTKWGKSGGSAVLSIKDPRHWKLVKPGGIGGVFCPSTGSRGHLLSFDYSAGVKTAPFDFARPSLTSGDTSVLDDVNFTDINGHSSLAVSKTGAAVYVQGNPAKRSLVWVDFDGKPEPLVTEQDRYSLVALSPNGTQALVSRIPDIWIYNLQRLGAPMRATMPGVTGEETSNSYLFPIWNGEERIYFASNSGGDWDIYSQPADNPHSAKVELKLPYDQWPSSVAPDGTLLIVEDHPTTGGDIWVLLPDGKRKPVRTTQFTEYFARFSPDGHWIAYQSDEHGQFEIYVQTYPEGKVRSVSKGGGTMPCWSRDGKYLFYLSGNKMMRVHMQADGWPAPKPDTLFDTSNYFRDSYDISLDGKRFLMIRRDPGSVPRQLNVIVNWSDELDRLVGKK